MHTNFIDRPAAPHFGNLPAHFTWARVIEMAREREGTKAGGVYDEFLVHNGKCINPYSTVGETNLPARLRPPALRSYSRRHDGRGVAGRPQ